MRADTRKRIRQLGYASYDEYLRSAHWRDLRARYVAKFGPLECFVCGTPVSVQLHHCTYERIGCELLIDVVPMCRSHHRGLHNFCKHHRVSLIEAHISFKAFTEGAPFKRYKKRRKGRAPVKARRARPR
jgi:hypothetical protein